MKKLKMYTNGQSFIMDGNIDISLHEGEPLHEVDITDKTDQEIVEIKNSLTKLSKQDIIK